MAQRSAGSCSLHRQIIVCVRGHVKTRRSAHGYGKRDAKVQFVVMAIRLGPLRRGLTADFVITLTFALTV